jgi:hypothetical protein
MNNAGKNERQKAFGERTKATSNRARGPDKLLVKDLTGPFGQNKSADRSSAVLDMSGNAQFD